MDLFSYHNVNYIELKKSNRLGLVYQGAKRNLADDILKVIYNHNPNATNFYDLFGGGGSISLYAKQCGYNVFYNDLNIHIYSVIDYFKKHRNNLDKRIYDFLSREEFYKLKEKENKTPVDYVMLYLYSFSNNFRVYFCEKKDEAMVRYLHSFIVNNDYESACLLDSWSFNLKSIDNIFKKFMIHSDLKKLDIFQRKVLISNIIKKIELIGLAELKNKFNNISIMDLINIKQADLLKYIGFYDNNKSTKIETYINSVGEDTSKSSIVTLKRVNTLIKADFDGIEISNKDYREVEIKHNPSDCILYCDIPYKKTRKYIESFNHSEFYKWCFETKEQGYNVFISEYDMPKEFKCIFEKEHIKKMPAQNNLKTIERLYIL